MNKNIIFSLLISATLVSCGPTTSNDSVLSNTDLTSNTITNSDSLDASSSLPSTRDDGIFISEVYGSKVFAGAVEIANINESTIDLSDYKLNIYSGRNLKKTISFDKDTLLISHDTYVIGNSTNDDFGYHSKCDLILDSDVLFGNNLIQIVDADNNEIIDTVGTEFQLEYATDRSYLKMPSKFISTPIFDQLNFFPIKTSSDLKYLGELNFPFDDENDILKGPKLTEPFISEYSYETDSNRPGGGITTVSVSSLGDGDTTNFRFAESFPSMNSVERTRYMMINTPEISHYNEEGKEHISEEPWGVAAKEYNNNILKNAKHILLQSVRGEGFRETYGRLLGFVWYTNIDNPSYDDYKLLNFEMVVTGFAYFGDSTKIKELYCRDTYYYDYFNYANIYATKLGLKVHGEKDPNFDYNE